MERGDKFGDTGSRNATTALLRVGLHSRSLFYPLTLSPMHPPSPYAQDIIYSRDGGNVRLGCLMIDDRGCIWLLLTVIELIMVTHEWES